MKKGDIVLSPFPFTDLCGKKNRPALIHYSSSNQIIVAFISTNLSLPEITDVFLEPTLENDLKKESILRLDKIATLEKAMVIGKLGWLEAKKIKEVNLSPMRLFKLR